MAQSNFEKILEEQLESVGTEADRVARISQIREQISQLENQIAELQKQLAQESESLNGDLAVAIRKMLPGLAVSLDGGRCNVRHMSNMLTFRPDFSNAMWEVEPNISGKRFKKYHGHAMNLKHDVNPLADNVTSFFRKRYKRLNNESVGPAAKRISDKAGHTMGFK